MEKSQCSNCTYYHRSRCVRFPPQIYKDNCTDFPIVESDMWCGEYEMNSQRVKELYEEVFPGGF